MCHVRKRSEYVRVQTDVPNSRFPPLNATTKRVPSCEIIEYSNKTLCKRPWVNDLISHAVIVS